MFQIDQQLTCHDLLPSLERFWKLSGQKVLSIEESFPPGSGTPVFTADGKYQRQAWTEWTQGFQFGSALLQFEATGEDRFREVGIAGTVQRMTSHLTHIGVHDHGFNNVSTYGNLLRLIADGRVADDGGLSRLCEQALMVSGAVQAARWTKIADGGGFIHSFNGPHSLFADTIRTLRVLALGHLLGQRLMGENDEPHSLLTRLVEHADATARFNVFYGEGRDTYDVRGRVAHESLFNTNGGTYRCPSTQQGYSPFSTWTRGLAWIMAGYAELLEFLDVLSDEELEAYGGRDAVQQQWRAAAEASCDFYIANSPTDGIPYWDTGAPGLVRLGDYLERPADPFNDHEPVDSSAAAIAALGLMRLGRWLERHGEPSDYFAAGVNLVKVLIEPPYLGDDPAHQGLCLHSIYHRPKGWDHIPAGSRIPHGEACLWGDYHLREAALFCQAAATEGSDRAGRWLVAP